MAPFTISDRTNARGNCQTTTERPAETLRVFVRDFCWGYCFPPLSVTFAGAGVRHGARQTVLLQCTARYGCLLASGAVWYSVMSLFLCLRLLGGKEEIFLYQQRIRRTELFHISAGESIADCERSWWLWLLGENSTLAAHSGLEVSRRLDSEMISLLAI